MTDQEIVDLVEHANALWNRTPVLSDLKAQRRAWKALLADLDYGAVKTVLNRLNLNTQYLPRPGEVRVAALGAQFPTPLTAWGIYQTLRSAVAHGTSTPDVPEVLRPFFKSLSGAALGLETNGDRNLFLAEYQKYIDAETLKLCAC